MRYVNMCIGLGKLALSVEVNVLKFGPIVASLKVLVYSSLV